MNIICLDAEFADNEELLELSIYNMEGKEIYHNYYKPEKIDIWRTDIHHITPDMVAKSPFFSSEMEKVQSIINSASVVTGFAVDNDLRVLTYSGIKDLDKKTILDVKDMFWFLKGRQTEMSPFSIPSLIVCSHTLNLDFQADTAHSASVDTLYTLKCFNYLFEEYLANHKECVTMESVITHFISDIEEARNEYIAEGAKGYVRVFKVGDLYKVKYGHLPAEDSGKLLFEIAVEDRFKAEYEIRKMLKKKEIPGKHSVYKLTSKFIDDIKKYRNTYDIEESAWCKKIIRNLSKITL